MAAIPVYLDGVSGDGGTAVFVKAKNYTPRGDQQITIATLQSVTALTVPANATVAFLQNNTTQAIRWRDSPAGTNPSTSVGQRIPAGETLTYDGALANLEMIAEAAGTGTLDIAYYS
jgi:hypothetical protein